MKEIDGIKKLLIDFKFEYIKLFFKDSSFLHRVQIEYKYNILKVNCQAYSFL